MLHASLTVLGRHPQDVDLTLEQWAEVCIVSEMQEEARALGIAKALEPLVGAMFKGMATTKMGR